MNSAKFSGVILHSFILAFSMFKWVESLLTNQLTADFTKRLQLFFHISSSVPPISGCTLSHSRSSDMTFSVYSERFLSLVRRYASALVMPHSFSNLFLLA